MQTKKQLGSADWTDPDDAPRLTRDMLDTAEAFEADRFVRRGPGRPLAETRKESISIRLDPDVLERLRASGPGWQSRVNEMLRKVLGLIDETAT